jgi:hypothetical protein
MGTSQEKLRAWNTGIHPVAEKVLGKEAAAGKRGHLHLGLEGQNIERVFCLICFFPGLPDESTATGVNTRLGRVGVRP